MPKINITDMERDAILCGLRILQGSLENGLITGELWDLYTNGDEHEGLDIQDINDLCEKVNV